MAENNGQVVWSYPSRSWDRNYGVRVFKTTITPSGDASVPSVSTTKVGVWASQYSEAGSWRDRQLVVGMGPERHSVIRGMDLL